MPLKKSEKERASGAVPSLHSPRVRAEHGARRGWLLTFAMVIVAGATVAAMKFFWMTGSGEWSGRAAIDTSSEPTQADNGAFLSPFLSLVQVKLSWR